MTEKLFVCSFCEENFNLDSASGCLRLPLLLDCSHRICSQCLIQKQSNGRINCRRCASTSQKCCSLPQDFYVIGLMLHDGREGEKPEEAPQQAVVKTKVCCSCGIEAKKSCNKCCKIICDICFAESHSFAVFSDHHLVEVMKSTESLIQLSPDDKICLLHDPSQTVYCLTCKNIACLFCSKTCCQHVIRSVKDENVNKLGEFRKFKESIVRAIESDLETLKVIDSNRSSWTTHRNSARESIDLQIANLIAVLQVVGAENKQKVDMIVAEVSKKLASVKFQLGKDIEVLQEAAASVDFCLENIPKSQLLTKIIENVEIQLKNIAVGVKNVGVVENPIKFEIGDGVVEYLKKQVKLTSESGKMEPRILTGLRKKNQKKPAKISKPGDAGSPWESTSDDEGSSTYPSSPQQASSGFLPQQDSYDVKKQDSWNGSDDGKTNMIYRQLIKYSKKAFNTNKRVEIPKPTVLEYDSFPAEVTNLVGLNEFYVRSLEPNILRKQKNLEECMQKFYNNPDHQHHPVYKPINGFYRAICIDGVWQRCQITRAGENHCQVNLIDVGKEIEVENSQLRNLINRFWTDPQAAIKCQLGDIVAKKENGYYFPQRALRGFQKILKFKIEIFVLKNEPEVHVAIDYFPGNGYKINFNAVLVHKLDCVNSIGLSTQKDSMVKSYEVETKEKTKEKKKKLVGRKKKRVEVDVLHVVDPSEFYVALKSRSNEANILQVAIQDVDLELPTSESIKRDWKCGDLCMVDADEYFRGQIIGASEGHFEVFLIDKGWKVEVEAEKITKIEGFPQPPVAIKVHLAGAVPTCGGVSWPKSSIQTFNQYLNRGTGKFISIVGAKNDVGSFPVIFWLATKVTGITSPIKFHNVSDTLLKDGYVDRVGNEDQVEVLVSDRDFGWKDPAYGQELTEESESEDESEKLTSLLTSWRPATPILLESFIGFPTNIDENGIITIQDGHQIKVVEELQVKLKEVFSKVREDFSAEVKLGQPVIVNNIFDGEFYRGTIEERHETDFKVKLIDFGCVEIVARSEIFTKVIAGNIPVQSWKFRLASLVPEGGEWSSSALDFMERKLIGVETEVEVIKATKDISECSIFIPHESVDILELLIDRKYARCYQHGDSWPPTVKKTFSSLSAFDFEVQKAKQLETEPMILAALSPPISDASPEETKNYLQRFNEDSNALSNKTVNSIVSSFTRFKTYRKVQKVLEFDPPKGIGKSRSRWDSIPPRLIRFFDLKAEEVKEFDFKFAGFVDFVYVTPIIDSLQQQIEIMEQELELVDENLLAPCAVSRKARLHRRSGHLCLVKSSDGWKRGKVVEISENREEMEIFLIDSVTNATVPADQVRKMPVKFQNFPSKSLPVALNGFDDLNSIGRTFLMKILKKFEGKQLRVIVKDFDENNYPVVDLLDGSGKLIYHEMIGKENFFN